jgi:hypothetical protein
VLAGGWKGGEGLYHENATAWLGLRGGLSLVAQGGDGRWHRPRVGTVWSTRLFIALIQLGGASVVLAGQDVRGMCACGARLKIGEKHLEAGSYCYYCYY